MKCGCPLLVSYVEVERPMLEGGLEFLTRLEVANEGMLTLGVVGRDVHEDAVLPLDHTVRKELRDAPKP